MKNIIIGITGHRLLSAKQKERIRPAIRKALENIMFFESERGDDVTFTALTPLAEGADTVFARAAIDIGIPISVVLPYEKDKYLAAFTTDSDRQEFRELYDQVPVMRKKELGSLAWTKEPSQLFMELGYHMVEKTDYLIAVWDEKKGKGRGGTHDTVQYAMEQKKNLLLINPDEEHPTINYLHYDHREVYKAEGIVYPPDTHHLTDFILRKQHVFEKEAGKYNKRYKRLWKIVLAAGIIEGFSFTLNNTAELPQPAKFIFATIEFLSLVFIVAMILFGRTKELHRKYVHNRIIAERLRIKRFFCELGYRLYDTVVSPIYFSFKEHPEFAILDSTVKLINLSAYSYWPFEKKKQHLETHLILDQQHYHERKMEKFEKKNKQHKAVRSFFFYILACTVATSYFIELAEYLLHHNIHIPDAIHHILEDHHTVEVIKHVLLFIFLFFPVVIAALEALKYLYEWEKIINLSSSMSQYFEKRAEQLEHIKTDKDLEEYLNAINRDMLIENLDWEKYMHDKNEVPA